MKLTIAQANTRLAIISQVEMVRGSIELSRETKAKVMRIRLEVRRIQNLFDEMWAKTYNDLNDEEYQAICAKDVSLRTEEEAKLHEEISNEIDLQFKQLCTHMFDMKDIVFTETEYEEIIDVNCIGNYAVDGHQVHPQVFLEAVHELFT